MLNKIAKRIILLLETYNVDASCSNGRSITSFVCSRIKSAMVTSVGVKSSLFFTLSLTNIHTPFYMKTEGVTKIKKSLLAQKTIFINAYIRK